MNIRKHWKKVVLSCAAALWAGCGDDASSATQVVPEDSPKNEESNNLPPPDTLYGVPTYSLSSSEVDGSCSSTPTSSEAVPSSSSAALSSAEEITSSSSEEKAGIIDSNLIASPAGVKVGDKFIAEGDTCEVVSTYNNWFGRATGLGEGYSKGAEEIESKIDSLTKDKKMSDDKRTCLENIKTMLDRGVAIYGPMPENYPQEVKCSDGIVKETEHYKERLKSYNKGIEEGYNETFEDGNKMIEECQK
ncbi:hypothetical protein [Fibrobacter sp.]|uniref:hypothetical protein n=1 Tax=Fibrobacter sp. TaxID=35828 RepID=UPI00388E4C96